MYKVLEVKTFPCQTPFIEKKKACRQVFVKLFTMLPLHHYNIFRLDQQSTFLPFTRFGIETIESLLILMIPKYSCYIY